MVISAIEGKKQERGTENARRGKAAILYEMFMRIFRERASKPREQ